MMFGSLERVISIIEGRNGDVDILTQREKSEESDSEIFDAILREAESSSQKNSASRYGDGPGLPCCG